MSGRIVCELPCGCFRDEQGWLYAGKDCEEARRLIQGVFATNKTGDQDKIEVAVRAHEAHYVNVVNLGETLSDNLYKAVLRKAVNLLKNGKNKMIDKEVRCPECSEKFQLTVECEGNGYLVPKVEMEFEIFCEGCQTHFVVSEALE